MNFGDDHDDDRGGSLFHPRKAYDLNSKIMLAAIISLSVVVILVVLLHIYARFMLRRHARRRSDLRQLDLAAAEAAAAGDRSAVPSPKVGLDPSVIAALPLVSFRKLDGGAECAVCLSVLDEEAAARLLPNCNHAFHVDCVDTWLRSHSTCPVCRTEAAPAARLEPEGREPPVTATAPPLDRVNTELRSEGAVGSSSHKIGGSSSSRLSSFRRILSRERSSRRIQPGGLEVPTEDLERR